MILAYRTLDGLTGHQAGWELLAKAYRQETGEALLPVCKTEWGKPCFADSPWHFSITHTQKHAFCVLARENIAIDAEELDRKVNLKLAGRVLSPGEKAQFDTAPDKCRALLTFWVLKEAAAKLSGRGIRGFPNNTDFSLNDPRVREIDGCLVAVMTE